MLFLTFFSIFKLLLLLKHFTGSFDDASEALLLKPRELVEFLGAGCILAVSARTNDSGVLSGSGGGELERSGFVSDRELRSFILLHGLSLTASLNTSE